jgi:hypothetical protein
VEPARIILARLDGRGIQQVARRQDLLLRQRYVPRVIKPPVSRGEDRAICGVGGGSGTRAGGLFESWFSLSRAAATPPKKANGGKILPLWSLRLLRPAFIRRVGVYDGSTCPSINR